MKLQTPAEAPPLNEAAFEKAQQAADQMAQLEAGYSKERDLVNQMLGQVQMAAAFGQFSRTVSASKLAIVKENKLYQQLSGMKTPNGSVLRGTWAEFCELLGMSVDKADIDVANVKAFGEEALEAMSRVGIGYRDLRQFRRLPDDQKTELIEAAKAGDKATLLELAEDLIARHTKEKEILAAEVTDAKQELAAKEHRLGVVHKQKEDAEKRAARIAVLPPNEALAELHRAATTAMHGTAGYVRGHLRQALIAVRDHGEDDQSVFMAGLVGQVMADLKALLEEFNLPDASSIEGRQLLAEMNDWMNFQPGSTPETQGPLLSERKPPGTEH